MKDYEIKISQFVDNELSVNEQQELFRFLSEDEEARQTLVDFMEMKKRTKSFYAGMNIEMDNSKIIAANMSVQNKKVKRHKTMFYFSAAAAILLAFMFLINQFKEDPILMKYQNLQTEMVTLQEKHNDALNKEAKLLELNNQLTIEIQNIKTEQLAVNKKTKILTPKPEPSKSNIYVKKAKVKNQNNYLANIPTYAITKDDFLGQQVIGN